MGPGSENCNPYNTLGPRGLKTAAPTTLWEPPQPGGNFFWEFVETKIFAFLKSKKAKCFALPSPEQAKCLPPRAKKKAKIFAFFGEQKSTEHGFSKNFAFLTTKEQK